MTGRVVALGALVLIALGACSSDGRAADGRESDQSGSGDDWVAVAGDGVAPDPSAPEVAGVFGDPFIDLFLGPERWDVADGAPPSFEERLDHADLIAFGEIVEQRGETILRIDERAVRAASSGG